MSTDNESLAILLENQDEESERLIRAACHELKQPVVGILGFAGILEEDLRDRVTPEHRLFIERILDNGRKLDGHLDRLRIMARAARFVDKQSQVELAPLLEKIMGGAEEQLRVLGGSVSRDPALPRCLRGATGDLELMFSEILNNALVFQAAGTAPRVEITCDSRFSEVPGTAHIMVRDNGIGIDERYHDEVFKACRKLLPNSEDRFGIGLTICRRITSRYGEKIWLDSAPGRGTTVHFTWATCD